MKIIKFHLVPPELWNGLCDASDEAWLFHRHEWVEVEAHFFAQENFSFGIQKEDGELVGIHPLYLRESGLKGWIEKAIDSGAHHHTGMATLNHLTSAEMRSARALAMKWIFTLAESYDVDRIQLNSHNLAPKNLSSQREEIPFWVTDYHFYMGLYFSEQGYSPVPGMATCCADQILNLEKGSKGELFQNLEESCRRAVRKAARNDLQLYCGESEDVISQYYALAQISRERTGEILPHLEYYESLFTKLRPLNKCKVLFALQGEKKVAALFLLLDKQSVSFMGGVSHPDYLPLRVNDFLHWSAIQWAKRSGYRYYRLGPVFPEVPKDWPIAKVSRFKKKFGGQSMSTIQGSYFRKPEKYLEMGREELTNLFRNLSAGGPAPTKEVEE